MHKNINDKTTVAAYRVFETLKYLIKKPASVSDIVNYLEKLDYADFIKYIKAYPKFSMMPPM